MVLQLFSQIMLPPGLLHSLLLLCGGLSTMVVLVGCGSNKKSEQKSSKNKAQGAGRDQKKTLQRVPPPGQAPKQSASNPEQTDEKEKNEAGNEKPDNADVKKEEKNEEVKEVETQGSDMPKGSKEGSNERSKQPQDKKPVDPKQKDSKEMPPTQDSKEKDPNPPKKDDKGKEKTTPAEGAPPVFVISDFEKKAADEGLLIHPNKVKYMGNIDNMYDERKEQMIKDIDEYKSDKSAKRPDASAKKDQKVTIKPEKCQVFETNDVATMDDDEEGEGEVGDIH